MLDDSHARVSKDGPTPAAIPSAACDTCRHHKVKCEQLDDNSVPATCKRCTRLDKTCVYSPQPPRRKRRRTDARVGDLEKKIDSLLATIRRADSGENHGSDDAESQKNSKSPETFGAARLDAEINAELFTRFNDGTTLSTKPPPSNDPSSEHDVVDRGILSMIDASRYLDTFVNELLPQYPIMHFDPGTTASTLRRDKPSVFLAVLACASISCEPAKAKLLNKEIWALLANKVLIDGQKSVDHVEALIISAVWHRPVENFSSLKITQMFQMATTMALDIGLDRACAKAGDSRDTGSGCVRKGTWSDEGDASMPKSAASIGMDRIRQARAVLTCYICCTQLSDFLRRPTALSFSESLSECLEELETSPYAVQLDSRLAAWVRLHQIHEEVATFSVGNGEAARRPHGDKHTQYILAAFEKRIADWEASLAPGVMNPCLAIALHGNNIFLHEVALHVDYAAHEFRPPFLLRRRLGAEQQSRGWQPLVNAEAITACAASAHTLLDVMLSMPVHMSRCAPNFTYYRTIYALVVLLKIAISAASPASQVGRVVQHQDLRILEYCESLDAAFKAAAQSNNFLPERFRYLVVLLRDWYVRYLASPEDTSEDAFEPLRHDYTVNGEGSSNGLGGSDTTGDATSVATPHDRAHGSSGNSSAQEDAFMSPNGGDMWVKGMGMSDQFSDWSLDPFVQTDLIFDSLTDAAVASSGGFEPNDVARWWDSPPTV